MITKTFICDKCKKSVGEAELYPVTTRIDLSPIAGSNYRRTAECKMDFCKDCLSKQGILVESCEDKDEAIKNEVQNKKTLENKFVDILSDLGVVFEE